MSKVNKYKHSQDVPVVVRNYLRDLKCSKRWKLSKVNKYKHSQDVPVVVRNYLRDLMIENKIERVVIGFSGSGDDGCVQDAEFYPENINDVGDDFVSIPKEVLLILLEDAGVRIDTAKGLLPVPMKAGLPHREITFELHRIFTMILEPWIQELGPVDWVNGEGGEGYCELTVNNKRLSIKIAAHEWIREPGTTFICKL